MKVLMITSSFPRFVGDVWGPWILDYSKELTRQGIIVHVVSPHVAKIPKYQSLDGVPTHRFKYWFQNSQVLAKPPGIMTNLKTNKLAKFQILPYFISGLLKSLKIIKKYNIQLIHCQWTIPSGIIGVFLSSLTKRPLIISIQGAELFLPPSSILSYFSKFAMAHCDLLLPVSNNLKRLALEININLTNIKALPNAVNINQFKPSMGKKNQENKDSFLVLTIRRLVPEKRVDVLIRAFAIFAKDKINVKLVIGGDGSDKENLKQLCMKMEMSSKTEFLGFVNHNQLPDLYNQADTYVLTSEQEGLSLSLLEALSSGIPVISTNIVGNPEVVIDNKTGFLFSPGKVEELANHLEFIYNNREIAFEIGLNARKFTVQNYSTRKIIQDLISLYKSVLGKSVLGKSV